MRCGEGNGVERGLFAVLLVVFGGESARVADAVHVLRDEAVLEKARAPGDCDDDKGSAFHALQYYDGPGGFHDAGIFRPGIFRRA